MENLLVEDHFIKSRLNHTDTNGYYNSTSALRDLDIQNDRNELIDIIGQIHELDRSVIPGPNFLH